MESKALGSRSELVGQPNRLNHFLCFLLVWGAFPQRRWALGVNKRPAFVPYLMPDPAFPPIRSRCITFLPPLPPRSPGNLSKTCTADGWTPVSIDYTGDCGYDPNDTVNQEVSRDEEASACRLLPFQLLCFHVQESFYNAVKVGYTVGHSVSLVSLTVGVIILCVFR